MKRIRKIFRFAVIVILVFSWFYNYPPFYGQSWPNVGNHNTFSAAGDITLPVVAGPYTENDLNFELEKDSVIPNSGKIKQVISKTKPEVRLQKWGEVDLGISYNGVSAVSSKNLTKIEYKNSKQEVKIYSLEATSSMEDGGMEFEVILNEKPATNIVSFQLSNWQDLDFFYQPELTAQEIDKGDNRPENVIGS
ncbi:MAG: hypothetical protein NUV83_01320, partial [Candidatus Wolfebacteria bacterium]|nr:hypothetical protein [Candidatus Wolfebacteria bacterium]